MFCIKRKTRIVCLAAVFSLSSPMTLAAGKIENATLAEVAVAIDSTIASTETTLAAFTADVDKEHVLELLKQTKQLATEIEVGRLGRVKGKAAVEMRKAKSALKKDDPAKAKAHVTAALQHYRELQKKFQNSNF